MNAQPQPFAVMGVVNVTPDSFSDGGLYLDSSAAIAHGRELETDGAAILDVGGQSTRPGAEPVGVAEELRRVIPVIEGLKAASTTAIISVDTSKAEVAAAALAAGATFVNDVTALSDPRMAETVAAAGAQLALMHMQGEPRTMQNNPRYDDVVDEVKAFLAARLAQAVGAGIDEQRVVLDPGIGFGKTVQHNLQLLSRLNELVALGRPVLIGTSRKSFIGALTGQADPAERLAGTIATNVLGFERGAALFRVHDVRPIHDALLIAAATVAQR